MFRLRRMTVILSVFLVPLLVLLGGSRFVSAESPPAPTRMTEPEFPTITGTLNNLSNPTWGAAHTSLRRFVPSAYDDGLSEPRGGGITTAATLPNTRDISNLVAAQTTSIINTRGVSDLFWQMFQFLDHDLDLTEGATPAEPFNVSVNPTTDPLLTSDISLSRSVYDEATGTTSARQQINEITTWIDASNIYGSDLARANWKRLDLPTGIKSAYLITSTGNLLPIETGTSPSGQVVDLFAAGDVRASEQSGLTAMHTLWMREHNRLVRRLRVENPAYSEEQLYQRARALVSAEFQTIVYNEMLPLLLGPTAIPAYNGYDNTIDPSINNTFSTAAFRFGHTMLSPQLRRLDPTGNSIPAGDLALRDAFFNIQWIQEEGIDSILRGLMTQPAQELDVFIIDDVRSFLFAEFPGSPGSDLAALNMQRGREHGLPSYNATRTALGLTPAATFADITSDSNLQTKLSHAYGGDINAVDLWIAGLAEDTVGGAMVGETFHAILLDQFVRLRDGDRFWHANRDWTAYGFAADPLLDDATALSSVRLADIVAWNANITLASDEVLLAGNVQFFSCDAVVEIPSAECEALVALYTQTNGDNWTTRTNWLETNTPCSWYGVECLTGGNPTHVLRLYLRNNNLDGTLPSELGNLASLQTASLYSNELSGMIPPELGNLASLQSLNLNRNELSGTIPAELGNLASLQILWVLENKLSGTIPAELGNLTSLQTLYLSHNELSGLIPSELENLTSLETLWLQGNKLSGTIPAELGNLASLQTLHLSENELSGAIPLELSNLTALTTFGIQDTQVCVPENEIIHDWLEQLVDFRDSGIVCSDVPCNSVTEIPLAECEALVALYTQTNGDNWTTRTDWLATDTPCSWYGVECFNGQVYRLDLSNNNLTGVIPIELENLSSVDLLYLYENQLSGTIPPELGSLTSLRFLSLSTNQLSGTIPSELGNLSSLQRLSLATNQLSGAIPPELGSLSSLQDLYLHTNQLTGIIPIELANLSSLQDLYLHTNQLTGTIPSGFGTLTSLQFLYLNNNQLSGTIPPELGNLASLRHLYLRDNNLSGPIPPELGNLTLVQRVLLENNSLSGSVPVELGNLSALQLFHLDHNELSGEIPSTLGNLTLLQNLYLSHNQLSGTIPAELGSLISLERLYLDHNSELRGSIPATLSNLSNLELLHLDSTQLSGALPTELSTLSEVTGLRIDNTQICVPEAEVIQVWLDQLAEFRDSGIGCGDTLQGIYVLAFDAEPTSSGNLSAYFEQTLTRLREGTLRNPGTRAIVLADLDGTADTIIFVIENGRVELISGLPNESGVLDLTLLEFNTADGEQIGRFLKWARDTYSAEKEIVTFIGHGNAITPETDYATLFAGADSRRTGDPLPTLPTYLDIDPTVTDAHTNDPDKPFDLLSTYDVRRALEIATDNGANPIDVLDLVHCFAATIEELFETSNPDGTPFVEMIVASPLYAYFASMMPGEALAAFDLNADAEELATTIMMTYQGVIDSADLIDGDNDVDHPGIITVVDAAKLVQVKEAVDRLAANLVSEFEFSPASTRQKLHDAYLNAGVYFDTNSCAPQQFELGAPDAVVDLGTFMGAIRTEFANSRFNVDWAALAVKSSVSVDTSASAIVTHTVHSGTPWFAGDLAPVWTLDHSDLAGLGIYADMGGTVKDGKTVISWQYPFYIDESAETGLQFVKNGAHPSWSDVMSLYWEGTALDTMICLPELPSTRSVGEMTVVDVLLAQGALGVGQATEIGISVRADTVIENSLVEVIIVLDATNMVVYSDTISTGYLPTGTHEIVMGLPFTPTVEGNYTIMPTVDVDNRVEEANEDDNQLNDPMAQRLIVHNSSGLTLDVQTLNGQQWFSSRKITLALTSNIDSVSVDLQYLVCNIFELSAGDNPGVHIFERTRTVTASDPSQPNFTLELPESVAAGQIEVQCRGIASSEFSVRPAKVAFNFAPKSHPLTSDPDRFVFKNGMSMDTLVVNVSADNGTVVATAWEPLNPFAAQKITVQAGQSKPIEFAQARAGDYVVVIEGTGIYTITGWRNGSPGRHVTSFISPVMVQLPRPMFISAPSNVEMLPVLEVMNVSEGYILDSVMQVEIKVERLPKMDAVALYVGDVHVGDGVPMHNKDGMYTVELDPTKLPTGQQKLMAKVMNRDSVMAETHQNICVQHCGATSAVALQNTEVDQASPPQL
ncbi:MAG: peroxidase family protein, partial [Candidatus Promineifilaceae bacterium]